MPDKPEPNAVDIHVGERLRRLRSVKNMTQQALGDMLGISFQQVQKYEKGANRISASKMFEIMQAFNTSADYFFDGLHDKQAAPGFAETPLSGYVLDMDAGKDEASSTPTPVSLTAPVQDTDEGTQLLQAFNAIGDRAMQRKLLELVKLIAQDHQQPEG